MCGLAPTASRSATVRCAVTSTFGRFVAEPDPPKTPSALKLSEIGQCVDRRVSPLEAHGPPQERRQRGRQELLVRPPLALERREPAVGLAVPGHHLQSGKREHEEHGDADGDFHGALSPDDARMRS